MVLSKYVSSNNIELSFSVASGRGFTLNIWEFRTVVGIFFSTSEISTEKNAAGNIFQAILTQVVFYVLITGNTAVTKMI